MATRHNIGHFGGGKKLLDEFPCFLVEYLASKAEIMIEGALTLFISVYLKHIARLRLYASRTLTDAAN